MTPEQARELFSEALDESLEPERAAEFRQLLAQDAALAAEYDAFRETLALTHQLGASEPQAGPIDVLPAVQRMLRQRSRGRFYRDRYAERRGGAGVHPLLLGAVMLLVTGLAWLAFELYATATVPEPVPADMPSTAPDP